MDSPALTLRYSGGVEAEDGPFGGSAGDEIEPVRGGPPPGLDELGVGGGGGNGGRADEVAEFGVSAPLGVPELVGICNV